MMGLKGTGRYNSSDSSFVKSFDDTAERDAAIKEEIRNRIHNLGPNGIIELLTTKGVVCFGDGTYGLSDFLDDKPKNDTVLHQFILYSGEHYNIYKHLCTGVLLALYLLLIASGVQEVFAVNSRTLRILAPRVAIWGLLLFLISWEASGRYSSNYIPLIFISSLLGLETFSRALHCAKRRFLLAWRGK